MEDATNVMHNSPDPMCGANRMSAKASILWKVECLRREADNLEQLAHFCDLSIPAGAEEALWRLANRG